MAAVPFLRASEQSFVADFEKIEIYPSITITFEFLTRTESLEAGQPKEVPLWMAVILKQKRYCSIKHPPWFSPEALSNQLKREKEDSSFHPLPSVFFWEISKRLLECAHEELPVSDLLKIKSDLDDLWSVRQTKITKGLKNVVTSRDMIQSVELKDIGAGELNFIRPLFIETLAQLKTLKTRTVTSSVAPVATQTTGRVVKQRPAKIRKTDT